MTATQPTARMVGRARFGVRKADARAEAFGLFGPALETFGFDGVAVGRGCGVKLGEALVCAEPNENSRDVKLVKSDFLAVLEALPDSASMTLSEAVLEVAGLALKGRGFGVIRAGVALEVVELMPGGVDFDGIVS